MKKIKTLWLASKRAQLKREKAEIRKQRKDQDKQLKLVTDHDREDKDDPENSG